MSEIVIRLREKWWRWADKPGRVVELEAADRIEELEAALAEAQKDAAAMIATLPGAYYMDPPDGGSVTPVEQMRRMAKDAARYRWLRDGCDEKHSEATRISSNCYGMEWDAAIDAARRKE